MRITKTYAAGVFGLLLSHITMYLAMKGIGTGVVSDLLFWVGVAGALAGYLGWILWLSRLAAARAGTVGRGAVLDGMLMGLGAASIFGVLVVVPQVRATSLQGDQLWMLGCLAGDAFILWLGLTVAAANPRDWRAMAASVGLAVHVVVDILHSAAMSPASPTQLLVGELALVVVFLAWFTAPILPADDRGSANGTHRMAHVRMVSLTLALATPSGLVAILLLSSHRSEAIVLLVAATLVAILVTIRTRGLVSDLAATNAQLQYQAQHDQLTGVWNRAAMTDYLANTKRPRLRAIAYLDLDGFKPVNDQFGHHAGDAILREVAQRLNDAVRQSDKVVRVGGDEFAVLITDHQTDLSAFRTRLDRALNDRGFEWEGAPVAVSASIGLAEALTQPGRPIPAEALLNQADQMMLKAKHAKKQEPARSLSWY